MSNFDVLIVGAGTGGVMAAAQLKNANGKLRIGLIDPADTHWYQPAWTLVGAGTFNYKKTARPMASIIPNGVEWIQDKVTTFDPAKNSLSTAKSGDLGYKFLIVAPGLQYDIDALPGLREALDTPYVCSNYLNPEKTWEVLQNFNGGNAVFTQPSTPIKCGGAPQKIMYLAEHYFRKSGKRDKTNVIFATPGSIIFGVPDFARTLNGIIAKRNIHFKRFYNPIAIDSANKTVTFKFIAPSGSDCVLTKEDRLHETLKGDTEITIPYDMLHLAPPQSAPDFVKQSPFAVKEGPGAGWMSVDKGTLQSTEFANVYGLGDVVNVPTAKTGAAIRKQAPVVVKHILAGLANGQASDTYEGYSSCPLVTGYGKMVLAEFKYDNVRDSDPFLTKFVDTSKEQWSMWILKKYGLPWLYWNRMMKGKM
jgi:sulfide:quinone oxidoreductase